MEEKGNDIVVIIKVIIMIIFIIIMILRIIHIYIYTHKLFLSCLQDHFPTGSL